MSVLALWCVLVVSFLLATLLPFLIAIGCHLSLLLVTCDGDQRSLCTSVASPPHSQLSKSLHCSPDHHVATLTDSHDLVSGR